MLSEAQTQASFTWDPNIEPDIAGYRVFHRVAGNAYNYSKPAWEGSKTSCTIDIATDDMRHYFVARAVDTRGFQSQNSDEVCLGCSTDSADNCPNDPNKTEPGVCGCGTPDIDTDRDGTLDCNDGCPNDPDKTRPGVNGCGFPEPVSDGGTPADPDNCPTDPQKTEPGICGCDIPDIDTDRDGTLDCNDRCPNDPDKTRPGVNGCGFPEPVSDGGTPADPDSCPTDPKKTEPGICGCGIPDIDTDRDGTLDCNDSCPDDPDKVRPGVGGCGFPEPVSDGSPADPDNCPNDPNKTDPGICGCGIPDIDTDLDGRLDCNDRCPDDPDKVKPGTCGCGTADTDVDEDDVLDCYDTDDDNDGISDAVEAKGPNQGDANRDGILDSLQCNVGSIKMSDKKNYISLESPEGTCISDLMRADNLPFVEFPQDVDFIYGLYEFVVQDTGYGKNVIATITLPQGAFPDTFYIYGPTPENPTNHWHEFLDNGQTGAEIEGNSITLFLTDGQRGDTVLTKDRMVVILGGPGYISTGTERDYSPDTDSSSSSGGSACFVDCLPK